VHGGVSDKDKQLAIEEFTHNPDVRVYLGNASSGGIGVNLTVSDYSIYFSRDFSLESDLQSESRNHRGGSEIHEKITRIDLVTEGTIDQIVLERLANKEALGESLLSALRGTNGNF
jgi:SNF2 family DNA or RNA helicase